MAEFAAAGLGAAVLVAANWSEYVPVLVCLVVGLHFFPLAPLLRDPLLRPLGAALCLVAVAGLVTGLASAVSAGLVVGVGAGVLLLAYAVQALIRGYRPADLPRIGRPGPTIDGSTVRSLAARQQPFPRTCLGWWPCVTPRTGWPV